MAIRIPKPSGASESVGGKTIRIPRDSGQVRVDLPSSNLLDRVPRISDSIDKIGAAVHRYALIKKARDEEIEKQRIINLNTKRKSLLANDVDNVNEDIKNNPNLSTDTTSTQFLATDGDYEGYYKKQADKLEKKYRKLYEGDDDALAIFESDMYEIFRKGQKNMRIERRKKVVADSKIAFHIEEQLIDTEVEALEVDVAWKALPSIKKRIINLYANGNKTFDATLDVGKRLTEIEDKIWVKQVTAGHLITDDMTGQVKVNYQAAFDFLNGALSTDTWHGKKMSKERKRGLLKFLKEQDDLQDELKLETDAKLNNDRTASIDKQILEYDAGNFVTPDGSHPYTWLKNQVLTLQITSDRKDALMDEINKVYKRQPKDISQGGTYGNPITMDKYIDMIMSNEARGQIFIDLVKNDKDLSAQGKKWIVDYAATWNKGIDKKSQDLIKEFVNNFPKVSADLPKQLVPFVGMARFEVSRVVDLLVAEAQKSGIAINELFSRKSIHFIGDKLMDVYSGSLIANMSKNYNMMADKDFDSKMFWDGKYNEVISAFIDADPDDPKKPETIGQHLKIDKVPIKDDDGNVIGYENVIDREYAIFFQRLMTKPKPPEPTKIGVNIETIEQLVSSQRWKDYEKAKLVWILGGGFNSSNIPSFDKWFQQADFPDIKINK